MVNTERSFHVSNLPRRLGHMHTRRTTLAVGMGPMLSLLAVMLFGGCGYFAADLDRGCGDGRGCPPGMRCNLNPLTARVRCIEMLCDNGRLDEGEACDDGNFADGDECAMDCSSDYTCGNRIVDGIDNGLSEHDERIEECDDGGETDTCTAQCKKKS
jgi:hypothetical protein